MAGYTTKKNSKSETNILQQSLRRSEFLIWRYFSVPINWRNSASLVLKLAQFGVPSFFYLTIGAIQRSKHGRYQTKGISTGRYDRRAHKQRGEAYTREELQITAKKLKKQELNLGRRSWPASPVVLHKAQISLCRRFQRIGIPLALTHQMSTFGCRLTKYLGIL